MIAETVRVYLSVRVPKLLDGKDLLRYLERKFRGTGLEIEPMFLVETDHPVFGLCGGLNDDDTKLVEVRGRIPMEDIDRLEIHPLVRGCETEAEQQARILRSFEGRNQPSDWDDDEPSGGVASGPGPRHPLAKFGIAILMIVASPFLLLRAIINKLRRFYLREFS